MTQFTLIYPFFLVIRPVSAYALFFRDTQAAIKGQNPNASFGEVSKIVASMWDVLAPEHKEVRALTSLFLEQTNYRFVVSGILICSSENHRAIKPHKFIGNANLFAHARSPKNRALH